MTILLDLRITIDDVPLGLSVQKQSAFQFAAARVWMKHIPEIKLDTSNLHRVLNVKVTCLLHFLFLWVFPC